MITEPSTFNLESMQFSFEEGMTFNDWSKSKYNIYGYSFDTGIHVITGGIDSRDYTNIEIEKNRQYYFKTALYITDLYDSNGNSYSSTFSVYVPTDDKYPREIFSADVVNDIVLPNCGPTCTEGSLVKEYRPYVINTSDVLSNPPYTIKVEDSYLSSNYSTKKLYIFQYIDGAFQQLHSIIGDGNFTFTTNYLDAPLVFTIFETS